MLYKEQLFDFLSLKEMALWKDDLYEMFLKIEKAWKGKNFVNFSTVISLLPNVRNPSIDLCADAVKIGNKEELEAEKIEELEVLLHALKPWRKGPFSFFGTYVDTEWRSDFKWDRLKESIRSLDEKLVLDVGCGNGYHCLRMVGAGAKCVLGIDPFLLYFMQFQAVNHFVQSRRVALLPIGMEEMPGNMRFFDTVFSMGILYHRRSPFDHLMQLKGCLKSGGELVLETLVIDECMGQVLVPEGRYAKMHNVWFIPSPLTLESWLKRCGFKNIRLIHMGKTTEEEQRKSKWMTFESLSNFLDSKNTSRTIEGHPAPVRAIFLGNT